MTVTGAMPTAAAGGLEGRPRHDETGVAGVTMAGDWVGPVGLLADASLASGQRGRFGCRTRPARILQDGGVTVAHPASPTDLFERERRHLVGLAYRMLGTVADAEDVVQEAWLRWQAVPEASIERPAAWLNTVTTRLALDHLRAARRRRESYVGPWLPEPVVTDIGPAETAELAESLRLGFLAVLDELKPLERAVFLLADVFDVPFAEIAAAVGKSEAACRQIAHRARGR